MKIKQRLALTDDKSRVVPYDSKEARYLFAAQGQEIPDALAEEYGIVDGCIPEPDPFELNRREEAAEQDDAGEDDLEPNPDSEKAAAPSGEPPLVDNSEEAKADAASAKATEENLRTITLGNQAGGESIGDGAVTGQAVSEDTESAEGSGAPLVGENSENAGDAPAEGPVETATAETAEETAADGDRGEAGEDADTGDADEATDAKAPEASAENTEEDPEVKKTDKPEDKQKKKPETKPILPPETKRGRHGRR